MASRNQDTIEKLFSDLKKNILNYDPVSFCEEHLTVDGSPMCFNNTGWKYLADIYRYVGAKAISRDGKPVVIVKGRQVGATIMATALELYFCTSGQFGASVGKPPMRVLHCFPALTYVQKFAKDKLSTMMRTAKDNYVLKNSLAYNESNGKRRLDVPDDTLTDKQFKYENRLWVDSNANDAQRLQGMSLDAIFYDEVQHMNQDDIGNSQRTLTSARYGPIGQGVQLFFGTPLQRGSNFHKMWEASDKRYYHLGCENCKNFFLFYTPGSDAWETIWISGNIVECPKCHHRQEKIGAVERGKWIPSQNILSNGKEPQYIGFHFNQLLIPNFLKETVLKEKPGIHPTNTERIWQNEILGEFYSGSDLPMSAEEIHKYCRNLNKKLSYGSPTTIKVLNKKILAPYQPTMFMGIDWGDRVDDLKSSAGKSYSSIVIISADKEGTINIENAFKLTKNDPEHKRDVVREMYRKFGIELAVSDLGHGQDIIIELQKEYGNKLLGCMNNGSLSHPVKYDPEELRIITNHHMMLEEIFAQMRKGKILFPWADYEKIYWLIEHCCSMEKEVKEYQGRIITRFIKGLTPNDGLMSLMYAYIAYKFYLTQGFKIKAYKINAKANGPVLAYLPRI